MLLTLAGLLTAQASTAAIAVGASTWWRPGCAAPDPACQDPDRALSLADDDAWRAAFLLGAFADAGRVRVLTEPDESTRDRTFPGGPPTAPSRSNLLGAVRALTAGPEPITLIVYLAAHGSAEDVFLADGPAPFAELRADIYASLGPEDGLLLISDACLSARWRSGWSVAAAPAYGFPPVDPSAPNVVEVAVDSLTPEDPEVNGGVLSYLVLSGLMGGADFDGDGILRAQELSDFVHAYTTGLTTPMSPVVRAPRGLPGWPLPAPAAASRVRLDRPDPRRWIVALPGGQVLLETLTTGEPRTLWLPPGSYRLLEIPVALAPADGTWRIASDTGLRYDLDGLAEGDVVVPEGPARTFPTARFRGVTSTDEDAFASPVPGPGPRALPKDWRRYHQAARGVVKAGGWGSAGTLLDGRPLAGARVQMESGQLREGWVAAEVGWQAATGLPSRATEAAVFGGAGFPMARTARWSVDARFGLGVDSLLVSLEDGTQAAVGPAGRVALSVQGWGRSGVGLAVEAAWSPTAWIADTEASGPGLEPDLDRFVAGLSLSVRP